MFNQTAGFIDAELVIESTRKGAKIKEIPIDYVMRTEGQSTVRWQDVFAIVKEALKNMPELQIIAVIFLVINRVFFFHLPLHGDIGFFGNWGHFKDEN